MKTSEERIKEVLLPLVKELKQQMFTPEYRDKITDADCVGIIVSKFCEWDINAVIECAKSAFEDSNFSEGVKLMEGLEEGEEVI